MQEEMLMPSSVNRVERSILKLRISIGVAEFIWVNGVEIYGGAVVRLSKVHLDANFKNIKARRKQKKWRKEKL